jgi:hypothetical protein
MEYEKKINEWATVKDYNFYPMEISEFSRNNGGMK